MGNWTTVSTTGGAAPTVPAAPNIVSVEPLPGQASIVQYGMWANLTGYWFACLINLPTTDSAYESGHLKKIHVIWSQAPAWSSLIPYNVGDEAVYSGTTYVSIVASNAGNQPNTSPTYWQSGPSQPEELDVIYAPWASSPLTYVSAQLTQDVVALTGTLSFLTENDDGVVTRAADEEGHLPCTVSLTIQAAAITSVTATDDVALRWYDIGGALHAVISVVPAGASNLPMNVTFWIDKGHGDGKKWQGWNLFASATPGDPGGTLYIGAQRTDNGGITITIPADYTTGGQYPPDSGENWTLYAAAGAYRSQDAFPTAFAVSTVVTMSDVTVNPFTASSVTATDDKSLRWQDTSTALHSVIEFIPVLNSYPTPVTAWIDKADGKGPQWQGWDYMSGAGETLYIGLPTVANNAPPSEIARLGLENSPTTGAQFPPTAGDQTWTLWAVPGKVLAEVPWANVVGAVSIEFTAVSIGVLPDTAITGIRFIPNPDTLDLIDYVQVNNGYNCVPHGMEWMQPDLSVLSDYEFSFPTVQKGHSTTGLGTVSGTTNFHSTSGPGFNADQVGFVIHVDNVWNTIAAYVDASHVTLSTPASNGTGLTYEVWNRAPDREGVNMDPSLANGYDATMAGVCFFGRRFTDSGKLQGGNSVPGTLVQYFGHNPPDWDYPPQYNADDGSVNLYRQYRYLIYAVSRRGTDVNGGTGVFTLQKWPDGSDHGDLTPAVQIPALDLRETMPGSIKAPLIVDPVTHQPTVAPKAITNTYLDDAAVQARNMGQYAISRANAPTVIEALALVDAIIGGVGLSKLGTGTTVSNSNSVFTCDIILSRGSGTPLFNLRNDGLVLFGMSSGAGGDITYPHVAVQWSGILVSSGGAGGNGPSVTVNGNSVNLWTANGIQNRPYMTMSASGGLVQKFENYISKIDANGIVLQHVLTPYGSSVDAQFSLGAGGFSLAMVIGATWTELMKANSSGLVLAPGTMLTSPVINLIALDHSTITIDPSVGAKISLALWPGVSHSTAVLSPTEMRFDTLVTHGVYGSEGVVISLGASAVAGFSSSGLMIHDLPTSTAGLGHGSFWADPADSYRVKWVN